MSEKTIQLTVDPSTNGSFDANTGLLILPKAGSFTVVLDDLNKDREAIDSQYKKDEDSAREKWIERSENNWTLERLQENYDANIKLAKEKREKSISDLKIKYGEISWIYITSKNRPSLIDLNQYASVSQSMAGKRSFQVQKMLEGGGFLYLEAFNSATGPKGQAPYGIYIQAQGDPKVLGIEWTDMEGTPISEDTKVAWYSRLKLHIYTEGLYGQEIRVSLFDKNKITSDDLLSFSNENGNSTEVRVVPANDREHQYCTGTFLNSDEVKVQKAVIDVWVDYNWCIEAANMFSPDELKIYPKIKTTRNQELAIGNQNYLNVSGRGQSFDIEKDNSNMALFVQNIETNIANFEHCRYEKIILNKPEGNTELLFDGSMVPVYNKNSIGLISGDIPKIFSIRIEGYETNDCLLSNQEYKHSTINNAVSVLNHSDNFDIQNISFEAVNFQAHFGYEKNSIGLNYLKYLWPSSLKDSDLPSMSVQFSSCRYPNKSFLFKVYPDIEWTLIFMLEMNASNSKSVNMPEGSVFARHQEEAREAGYERWRMNETGKVPVNLGIEVSAEWNNQTESASFSNEFKNRIKPTVDVLVTAVNVAQEAINFAQSAAKETALPLSFDIKYPKFEIEAKWYLDVIDEEEPINTIGELSLAFKPIIGAEISIDIIEAAITAVSYGTTANPAAARFINKFRKSLDELGANLEFEAKFSGQLEIEADALKIDAINGISNNGKLTFRGRFMVEIFLNMNLEIGSTNGASIMPIVKVNAEAKAHGYFGGVLEINSDIDGLYIMPILEFSGVKIGIEISGEIGWWESSFSLDETIIPSSKKEYGKTYLN